VNELSTTIDLESTLIRAEALFRRFQRTVEAIDKKSNFPAPKLRQRPVRNTSNSLTTTPAGPGAGASANTSGVDAVTAGSTNSGADSGSARPVSAGADKGKRVSGELEDVRPKVISPELRGLLSRKVEVLPRKVVRKTGEGLSSLSTKDKK
jgi:TBC1 domain family member 15